MKIVVFGSGSFIGDRFIQKAKNQKLDLIVLGRNPLLDKSITFRSFDANLDEIPFSDLQTADLIINFIASGVQSNGKIEAEHIFQINFNFVKALTEGLKTSNYKGRLITLGTYFEIGNEAFNSPITEQSFLDLLEKVDDSLPPYIQSKRALSNYLRSKHLSFSAIHLILPTIYGKGETEHRLLPYLHEQFSKNADISVSSGKQVRSYLHVSDLVALLFILCEKDVSGLFLVDGESDLRIADLVEHVRALYPSYSGEIKTDSERKDEFMPYLCLDGNHLKREVEWSPKITLTTGIKEYIHA